MKPSYQAEYLADRAHFDTNHAALRINMQWTSLQHLLLILATLSTAMLQLGLADWVSNTQGSGAWRITNHQLGKR